MKKRWLLLALTAGSLHAVVVIKGTVVENDSGHPLARAIVTAQAVSGGLPVVIHSDSNGAFQFASLPAGSYVVSAVKLAFAEVQYGQKRWHAAGMPITLADNDTADLTIRLPHYGAFTGVLLDENDVGLPEHDLAVYSNTRPPRMLARARTDDRGMYKVWGIPPGTYLVRTLSKQYDDGGYLPTFYRDAPLLEQSHTVQAVLNRQVDHVDIRPTPGQLLQPAASRVTGSVSRPPSVTISADTGTEFGGIDSAGNFTFSPMAPGNYELLAQGTDHGRPLAAFQTITIDRDRGYAINLTGLPTVQFVFEDTGGQPIDPRQVKILARRKDLATETKAETLLVNGKLSLLPGRWDVALAPTTAYCAMGFTPPQSELAEHGRADGWNEMLLTSGSQNIVKIVLSASPATLSGTVKSAGGDVVAGVPVFLESFDLDPRK